MALGHVAFWTGFGVAVRFWQLGLQMRPFIHRHAWWGYAVFGGVGASFGHWMKGVDERQRAVLENRKQAILDKRARREKREAERTAAAGDA